MARRASPLPRPPQSAPWLVSVGLPTDIALAPVMQRLTLSGIFILMTLMVAFGIAWMLSGRIVRPLRQLRRDASAIASGVLSHRSAVHSQDEVGVLADAFNRMAISLDQRQDEASRAADDLRRANDTLATVIDASPVAIVCSDLERRIFIWSRAAEQIFGYSAEEATGQLSTMIPPKRADESSGLFDRAVGGETVRDLHLKRRRKDGTLVDVRAAAAPMYNPDGSVRGVARAYEDITDKVRAEQQLNRVAHYDQLTGLPNRLTLQKELGRLLAGDNVRTDHNRAVRPRWLQGRERHARPLDRRPAPDRGRPSPDRCRGRPRARSADLAATSSW